MENSVAVAIAILGVVSAACSTLPAALAADAVWKPQKNDTQSVPVPMTVMNKPGQGQSLGIAYVNAHPGDAHYLILISSSWVTTAIAAGSTTTHRDLTPIIKLMDGDLVLFVPADSPVRSMRDVAEALRKNPASLSFAFSTSMGNASHIALAELARLAGAEPRKLRLVVNQSGSVTATQVAGGHVSAGISSSGSAQAMVAAGKARLIGTISSQRLPQLPDLLTLREQGYDIVASTWWVVFGPKGLTPAQVAYWEDVIGRTMRHPEARKFADSNNWTIELTGSKDLPGQLDREHARLRGLLTDLGMVK